VVIGGTSLAFQHGWAGSAYPLSLGFGTLVAGLMFAVMRRYKFMTLSEEIACYYSKNRYVVEFSNISLFVSQVFWLTVQILGGTAILSVVTEMPREACLVISCVVTAMISIPGGVKTVIYTDFIQAGILLSGFGILLYTALSDSGGFSGLLQDIPKERLSFLGMKSNGTWEVMGLMVAMILSNITDPGRRLAMFTARSEKGAKWSMVTGGAMVMAFSLIIGVVGMYAYKKNLILQTVSAPDQAMPWLVINVLPVGLAAVMVVALAAAAFSSATTNAATIGSFFVRHIYPLATGGKFPKNPLRTVRFTLITSFLIALSVGFVADSIVGFIKTFLPVTMSGLAIILVVGRYWKRATWQGALAALITTPAVSLIVMFLPLEKGTFWSSAIILSAIAGTIAHFVVSLATPRSEISFEKVVEDMHQQRKAIEEATVGGK
jgi:SSS family solute:Na+ symporter